MSANSSLNSEMLHAFLHNRMGIAGMAILGTLAAMSLVTFVVVPPDTLDQWNNPGKWISHPKAAMPVWANVLAGQDVSPHMILDEPFIESYADGSLHVTIMYHVIHFDYDQFPSDFIYNLTLQYRSDPLVQINVSRPDGLTLPLFNAVLPHAEQATTYSTRVFSTDSIVRKNLLYAGGFGFDKAPLPAEEVVFSHASHHEPLAGDYYFVVRIIGAHEADVHGSVLVVGGKAYGLMGTDELRRDLAVGLLWGTPLALFIGLAVSVGSVAFGLGYGVYSGYRGRGTDEVMMRFNDVVYALPALPFLIILAVTVSNSIFVMVFFLMIFGWVGIAKVSRSMALQIKTRGYVEAARIMGQKDRKIMTRHILPQLLPYAFASVAISVPAAITAEAGLSFLGLGDPSFPTWGQILHDANTHGAASRGLWWWIVPPGIMIAITGLAFVFMGNALDTVANPRLKSKSP